LCFGLVAATVAAIVVEDDTWEVTAVYPVNIACWWCMTQGERPTNEEMHLEESATLKDGVLVLSLSSLSTTTRVRRARHVAGVAGELF